MNTAYPAVKFSSVDVLAAGGKAYSCVVEGGGLKPKLSAQSFSSGPPSNPWTVLYSPAVGVYGALTKTELYYSSDNEEWLCWQHLDGSYEAIDADIGFMFEVRENGKPRTVFVCGREADYITPNGFSPRSFPTKLCGGVMHCGRLFGVTADNRQKIVWSSPDSYLDFDTGINAGGYLFLDSARGDVLEIMIFNGKITLVREYGITVLSFFGSPENFGVQYTDTDTKKIYKGTARVVDGKLLFFAESGLMQFDGAKVAHISHGYDGDIYGAKSAAEFGGKYYLSCTSKSAGKVIFCYGGADGESYLIKADADVLYSSDAVYGCKAGANIKLGAGGRYEYQSPELDFGTRGKKTVTEIFIGGTADIEISNGERTLVYSNASGLIKPRMRGTHFTVKVCGTAELDSLTAKAEVSLGI